MPFLVARGGGVHLISMEVELITATLTFSGAWEGAMKSTHHKLCRINRANGDLPVSSVKKVMGMLNGPGPTCV